MAAPRHKLSASPGSGAHPSSARGLRSGEDPNPQPKRVLIVDDEPTFRLVARASLEAAGFQVEEADNGRIGIAEFKRTRPDIVLLDIRMPEMDGYETCAALRGLPEGRETPIVVLTGLHDADSVEKAYEAGATDFISKPVNYAILNHRLQQILRANRLAADFDELTGLPNRTLVLNHLRRAVSLGRRARHSVAVLYIDLDGFKELNETRGYWIGDEILSQVASRLGNLRSTDYLARNRNAGPGQGGPGAAGHGGDEFILVLPDVREVEDCAFVAKRIAEILAPPFRVASDELQVTASVGISAFPVDAEEPLSLLTRAEVAMRQARAKGGDRHEFFQETLNARTQRKFSIEAQLRETLEQGELPVHFQPRVDLQQNRIAGMEALARWPESLETVAPEEFVPVADQTGLAALLGDAVLRAACARTQELLRRGLPAPGVSINLSAAQLAQQGIASRLGRIVAEAQLQTSLVELEFSEAALLEDPEASAARLKELRGMGFAIALDRFGSGDSALGTLRRFPLDALKIDRSCIAELTRNPDASLAQAIIAVAKALSLKAVAVGVEEPKQLEILRDLGCDQAQGHLFSRALPFEALVEWSGNWEATAASPVMQTVADSLRGSSERR